MKLLRNSLYVAMGNGLPLLVALATIPFYVDAIGMRDMAHWRLVGCCWVISGRQILVQAVP